MTCTQPPIHFRFNALLCFCFLLLPLIISSSEELYFQFSVSNHLSCLFSGILLESVRIVVKWWWLLLCNDKEIVISRNLSWDGNSMSGRRKSSREGRKWKYVGNMKERKKGRIFTICFNKIAICSNDRAISALNWITNFLILSCRRVKE